MEMTLKGYLGNIGMSLGNFCKIIDASPCYISQIMNGHRPAGKRLAKEIENATGGLVRVKTLQKEKKMQN